MLLHNVYISIFCFVFLADHLELDAQISASDTPGQVERYGDRFGSGKVPVFRVPRNCVHSRHGLSKSTSKYIKNENEYIYDAYACTYM